MDRLTLRTYSSSVAAVGPLIATSFSGPILGTIIDQPGERIGSDAGLLTVVVPIIFRLHPRHLAHQLLEVRPRGICGHAAAMQKSERIRDAGNETADREAEASYIDAAESGFGEILTEAIGIIEGAASCWVGTLRPMWRR